MTLPENRTFTLAPSDLTFLFSECTRCFYLKIVRGVRRPSIRMPAVFTIFDRQQKLYFQGRRTPELHPTLPSGIVERSDLHVRSAPISIPGSDVAVEFRGSLDAAIAFDDGTYGIIDMKTTEPKADLDTFYSPQLHAYALAVERPSFGRHLMSPVNLLGLLCFEPKGMVRLADGDMAYRTSPTWLPVARDDTSFMSLLALVAEVLSLPTPPEERGKCQWCRAELLSASAKSTTQVGGSANGGFGGVLDIHKPREFGIPLATALRLRDGNPAFGVG